jgi:hypothetical protein
MKKYFVLCCVVLFSFMSVHLNAQNQFTAKVISEVPIGNDFYYLLIDVEDNIYKTSMFDSPKYTLNELVPLMINSHGNYEILNSDGRIGIISLNREQTLIESILFEDLPTYSNDILYFRDENHLAQIYNQFVVFDSILIDVEQELIAKSFKSNFNDFKCFEDLIDIVFGDQELTGLSDDQMTVLEEFDFISDYILKSIFSEHRLIGIGERVYYYNYHNEIISVDKTDSGAIDALKDVSSNGRFDMTDLSSEINHSKRYRFEMTEYGLNLSGKFDIEDFEDTTIMETKDIVIISINQFYVSNIQGKLPEPCNVRKVAIRVETWLITGAGTEQTNIQPMYSTSWNNAGYNTVLQINWGDGTYDVIQNYDNEQWFEHEYANYDIYDITTEMITAVGVFNDFGEFNAEVECASGDHANWKHTESGSYRLRSKIWVKHNVFGKHVGSYTHAYEKDGNNWKKIRAKIYTSIDGNFRNEVCTYLENKADEKSRNNKKEVQKTKTKFWAWIKANTTTNDNDVQSYHTMQKGSTIITVAMQLKVCV